MSTLAAIRQHARKISKAVFWLMTPWRLPQRLRFLRDRSARNAQDRALALLVGRERLRTEAMRLGLQDETVRGLDLYDDADVMAAASLPRGHAFWRKPTKRGPITDRASAARFMIHALRERKDLRPVLLRTSRRSLLEHRALGLQVQRELNLKDGEVQHLVAFLSDDFGARARQFFLTSQEVRAVLPHGLMPSGRRNLFWWFMQHGLPASGLSLEEVWWLFLQAAENPQAERVQAFLFTPDWQSRFPDAFTVFGWQRFSCWVDQTYGADESAAATNFPADLPEPSVQLRIAYRASAAWQVAHPHALSHPAAARGLITWLLYSDDAQISPEARAWCAALDVDAVVPAMLNGGVNVIGHFCYPSGLRVSVEALVEAMKLAGIPTSLRDLRTDVRDEPLHARFDGLESGDVTIIHVQPEPFFANAYSRADLAERKPRTYRIAYWYWEFDTIPDSWCAHAETVDEVWTATEFIAQGLRKRLSVPVRTLFPGVTLAPFHVRERCYFKLNPDHFTFLFTFHMMSVMERKNPIGLIRAFKQAFPANEPVTLVLKTSFGDRHPVQFQELCGAIAGEPRIVLIDEVFSSDEVLSLMNVCDAYVSLHRSEGLGLTMAEAMLMGKPVIATAFSGNMDFMNEDNSLLVPYERVKVGQPIPPYDSDLEWAQPSEKHAAKLMRRLFDNQDWAREVGARGKRSAEINLSLDAAGRRIADRLDQIAALRKEVARL